MSKFNIEIADELYELLYGLAETNNTTVEDVMQKFIELGLIITLDNLKNEKEKS